MEEIKSYIKINHLSKSGSLYAEPVVMPGLLKDMQLVLKEIPSTSESAAKLRITFFPLMSWIWAGGGLMAGGGAVSLASGFKRKKEEAIRDRS